MSIAKVLLGRRLKNSENEDQKIGVFAGVPSMGLDGLGSSAYGPEAALTVLIPLGAAGLAHIVPIMLAILVLLAILYVSYRQTISAYPSGGGAYTVARENLGTFAGLLAAAALMIDYVLNVAVGISAGVGALVSALPALHPWTLTLCLAILALITVMNLRGATEAGLVFSVPTYLFIASFAAVIGVGLWTMVSSGGHPAPVVPPPALPGATEAVSLWLLLRAFASGCTAMTGVEAVSNGVTAFREPRERHAQWTLTVIVVVLGTLLGGIALLVRAYGIGAMDQTQPGYQSVLSQLVGAAVGRGWLYYVAIGSLLAILCLSANTSFVGFPRLCRTVAQDGYLPKGFTLVGRRLVYSVGILFLTLASGALLVVFGGITDRLIPLFAVGAFLAFTLSQAGMVFHWRRMLRQGAGKRPHSHVALAVNALGTVTTAGALAIIIAAKFTEGAWITVLVIPCTLVLLKTVRRHYDYIDAVVCETGPLRLRHLEPPVVVIAIETWNRLAQEAVRFALRLSPDVVAVHLSRLEGPDAEDNVRRLRFRWTNDVERPAKAAGVRPPGLEVIQSPYRTASGPLLGFLERTMERHPGRVCTVLIPEVMPTRWWENLLHTHRARSLRTALLRHGGPHLTVINMPFHVQPATELRVEEEKDVSQHA